MSTAGPQSTALIESLCPGVPYSGVGLSFRCLFPISARGGGGFKDTGGGKVVSSVENGDAKHLSVKTVTAIFDPFFFIVSHHRILVSFRNKPISTTSLSDRGSVPRRGKRADVSVSGDEMRTLVKMKHGDERYGSSETEGCRPDHERMKPCSNRPRLCTRLLVSRILAMRRD